MKIKFNWGTGIIIVIILFFASMAFRIWLSYQQDINLVYEDYYPRGIRYQDQIEYKKNYLQLKEKPIVGLNNDTLSILFPEMFTRGKLSGEVLLYRPSDSKKDIKFELDPNQLPLQKFVATNLLRGKYILKMTWQHNETTYYTEQELFVTK